MGSAAPHRIDYSWKRHGTRRANAAPRGACAPTMRRNVIAEIRRRRRDGTIGISAARLVPSAITLLASNGTLKENFAREMN
jgi:hypothetical protein